MERDDWVHGDLHALDLFVPALIELPTHKTFDNLDIPVQFFFPLFLDGLARSREERP